MDDLQIAWRPLGELIPYARNPRTHNEAQVAQIAASIREFGWTNPVLVDGDSGIIVGHGRVLAARKLGLERIPVIEVAHMSEAQKRAYVLADNQLALNAGWDDELLRLELADLSELGFDLGLIGFAELGEPEFVVVERSVDLPATVVLGSGGRSAPTETIDDDGLADFEPSQDGVDFYESLEGMRVTVLDTLALSTVNGFGEVWVLASGGVGATSFDGEGAVVMTEYDLNPERILIDLDLVDAPERVEAGTRLGNIAGVMSYAFGNYRVLATEMGGRAPRPVAGMKGR